MSTSASITTAASFKGSRADLLKAKASRMKLALGIALWRHGWLWLVGVSLLACCGAFALWADWSLAQDRSALDAARKAQQEEARLARGPRPAPVVALSGDQLNADRQAALLAVLRPTDQSAAQVQQIYQLASRFQVSVLSADFQSQVDQDSMERMQIAIPTKTGYPQLRRFLEAYLRANPNASLDKLSFKRGQAGDTQVEARIHLSLWLSRPVARGGRP